KDNGATAYTTDVVVNNVAPTATLSNDGPVNEGSPATASFSNKLDPSTADTTAGFRYQYHCDGSAFGSAPDNATADTSDSHQCTFNDNGTYTVRARIIDKDNGARSDANTSELHTLASTASLPNDDPVNEGSPATASFSNKLDPSTADPTSTLLPYTTLFRSAFGSAPDYATADTSDSHQCTFNDNGTYTVRARIIDKDNGATAYTTDVRSEERRGRERV